MSTRSRDGSAGDADYGLVGAVYAEYRTPEPSIAAVIETALGGSRTVLNVGSGAGAYEPPEREVTAVEPSSSMRALRRARKPVLVDALAERLPFADRAFDAAMTTFSIHQWSDLRAGLSEMRRVARGPVVMLTCDPARLRDFWLYEYAPEVLDTEARRYPSMEVVRNILGGTTKVTTVPIPINCQDGFNEAYYARPERLLDPHARKACSAWGFVEAGAVARFEDHLAEDLRSGRWDARHGHLRQTPQFEGALVLAVSDPE